MHMRHVMQHQVLSYSQGLDERGGKQRGGGRLVHMTVV